MFAYRALFSHEYRKLYAVHAVYHRKTKPPGSIPVDLVEYQRDEILGQSLFPELIFQLQATMKAMSCYDYLFEVPYSIKRQYGLRRN